MSNYSVSQAVGETTLVGIAVQGVTVFERDTTGLIVRAGGATLPDAKAGYAVGSVFSKTSGGRTGLYVNVGTSSSCAFERVSPPGRSEYAIVDGGTTATAGGDATEVLSLKNPANAATDLLFAGISTTDDTDQTVSQIVTNTTQATIVGTADPSTAHAYDWFTMRPGAKPVYDIVAAGTFQTAGGDATESITAAAVAVGDLVLVQLKTKGAGSRTVAAAVAAAGAITVTLSGDPSTDHVLSYIALRLAGSFKPSHYIVAAGNFTTVGGDATESITVSGLLSTDVAFAVINTTNDTDVLVTAAAATGAITVVQSADPLTAHKYSYFAVRAFT